MIDKKTFITECLEHSTFLNHYALKLTRNKEEAQDLCQDTYARALRYQSKFKPGTSLRAWLYTIMRHGYINQWRAYKRYEHGKRVDIDALPDFDLISPTPGPEDIFHRAQVEKAVAQAIENLPKLFRAPAQLKFEDDLEYSVIGRHLGLPCGTAKSNIYRGRKRMQKALAVIGKSYGLGNRS